MAVTITSKAPTPIQRFSTFQKKYITIHPNFLWFGGISLTVSTVLWSNTTSALIVPSSLTEITKNRITQNKNIPYTPPPDAGTPEPTGGTGSRGGCIDIPSRPNLATLVGQSHLMLTTSDRPVFWIYVPYSPNEAPSGFFSLQQGDDAIYESHFSLESTPGVVGIRLPDSAPPLVVDQEYDWFIDIHCLAAGGNSTKLNNTPGSLDGLVQRVDVPTGLASDLSQAQTGLEVVAAYGKHHIWYDWITELARLRLEITTDAELENFNLETAWTNVLADEQAVMLAPWANEPLAGETVMIELPNN